MRSSDGGATYTPVSTALATQTDANGNPYVVLTDPGTFGSAGTVPDGTYLYSAQVEDIAGNTDNPKQTPPQTVVVDTTPPNPVTFRLAANSDTGLSNSDGVTNPTSANPADELDFTVPG